MTTATAPLLPTQKAKAVLGAEVRRLTRQGGLRRAAAITASVAVVVGTLAALLIDNVTSGEAEDVTTAGVTLPMETAAGLAGLLFAIAVTMFVGRAMHSGATDTSLVHVPRRRLLWNAQYFAVAIMAATVAGLSSAVVGVMAFMKSGSAGAVGVALLAVVAATVAAALLASIAQSTAYLTGSSSTALLVTVGWWIIAPIALGLAATFLNPTLASIASGLGNWTPILMYTRATTITTVPTEGVTGLALALLTLSALAIALAAVTQALLRRRDF